MNLKCGNIYNMRMTNRHKEVLSTIGKLGLIAAAFVAPNVIQLLKPSSAEKKYRYKKIIDKMFDDKIIFLSGERIELTDKGLKLLKQIQIEDISLNEMKDEQNWDGIWHLVCYDIPEKFKKERDQLRHKLFESNFYLIQLSLWVYPFDCKEEIAVIAQNLGIAPFVAYLNTDHLPQQQKLLKHFHLQDNLKELD